MVILTSDWPRSYQPNHFGRFKSGANREFAGDTKRPFGFPTMVLLCLTVVLSLPGSLREAPDRGEFYIFSAAFLEELICLWLILGASNPGAALVVGPILVAAPYSISRALANRLARGSSSNVINPTA